MLHLSGTKAPSPIAEVSDAPRSRPLNGRGGDKTMPENDSKAQLRRALAENEALPYRTDIFYGRSRETDAVERIARALLNRERLRIRVINVLGEKGAGKTWFLRNLHEILAIKNIESTYIDFETKIQTDIEKGLISIGAKRETITPGDRNGAEAIALDFMKALAQRWGARTAGDATLHEQGYWLSVAAERKRDQVLVLLLDSVSMAVPQLLDVLEDQWLKHLVRLPNVLVVMSGRGDMPSWISPELREVEEITLEPFPKNTQDEKIGLDVILDKTNEHLQYELGGREDFLPHRHDNLDELYRAGGGFPFSSYYLARRGIEKIDELIDTLLDFVPLNRKGDIKSYIEAICVLNPWSPEDERDTRFRDEHMLPLLSAYHDREYSIAEVRAISRELQSLRILRWERGASGYAIDSALRYPIAYALQRDRQRWHRLHCAAHEMFSGLAERFTQHETYYKMLAKPHSDICVEPAEARTHAAVIADSV